MSILASDGSLLVTFVDSGDTNTLGRWASDGSQRVTVTNTTSSSPTGTTTNDDAAAGRVGEYLESIVTSPITLANTTAANVTSLSLTAGDWTVQGMVEFATESTTNIAYLESSINTTSATRNTTVPFRTANSFTAAGQVLANPHTQILMPRRFSLAATTTIYLVQYTVFSANALYARGALTARRIR